MKKSLVSGTSFPPQQRAVWTPRWMMKTCQGENCSRLPPAASQSPAQNRRAAPGTGAGASSPCWAPGPAYRCLCQDSEYFAVSIPARCVSHCNFYQQKNNFLLVLKGKIVIRFYCLCLWLSPRLNLFWQVYGFCQGRTFSWKWVLRKKNKNKKSTISTYCACTYTDNLQSVSVNNVATSFLLNCLYDWRKGSHNRGNFIIHCFIYIPFNINDGLSE